jgi:hypothetical protein
VLPPNHQGSCRHKDNGKQLNNRGSKARLKLARRYSSVCLHHDGHAERVRTTKPWPCGKWAASRLHRSQSPACAQMLVCPRVRVTRECSSEIGSRQVTLSKYVLITALKSSAFATLPCSDGRCSHICLMSLHFQRISTSPFDLRLLSCRTNHVHLRREHIVGIEH